MFDTLAPPSPALSFCSSIASDDLDALLDNLGPLSGLPTPPPAKQLGKDNALISVTGVEDDEEFADNYDYAQVLTSVAAGADHVSETMVESVARMLDLARLPLETLALAYNILDHLNPDTLALSHIRAAGLFSKSARQTLLVTLSALYLGASTFDDVSQTLSCWSRDVAEGSCTARELESTNQTLLANLDWRLHPLTSADKLASAIDRLQGIPIASEAIINVLPPTPPCVKPMLLRLDSNVTKIQHGLPTPTSPTDGDKGCPFL